ncbi:High cysteine membrane protein [Giardia muris]|uniref:High cysteine membrane protein n=1 Tax=Giardia muris TaxID=5742 RepID=A0A4Z1T0T1_GIAMU|nr:High cysteine membrane protein [Giardia muris]|eukprot:TNJ29308.1 High cysteine membrane protein [Giardia muris]
MLVSLLLALCLGCVSHLDCSNIGKCIDGVCQCPFGTSGPACADNPCHARLADGQSSTILKDPDSTPVYSFCNAHGICKRTTSDGDYTCDCLHGYEGLTCDRLSTHDDHENCRTYTDGEPTYCNRRGRCVENHCECYVGFSGDKCQDSYCDATPNEHYVDAFGNPQWLLCNAGGECVPNGDGYICSCRHNFEGEFCQSFTCHSASNCHNGGSCFYSSSEIGESQSHCVCREGFFGLDCYYNMCGASSSGEDTPLCSGSGRCVISGNTATGVALGTCECNTGHYGSFCETFNCDVTRDACNGGMCIVDAHGAMRCINCPEFRYGLDCAMNPCGITDDGTICNGYGTCVDDGDTAKCNCHSGRMGETCNVPDCLSSGNECQHGGVCVGVMTERSVTGSTCECPRGYAGILCESCESGLEMHTQYFENGTSHKVCAAASCIFDGDVCSNRGNCTHNSLSDRFECVCEAGFQSLNQQCIHASCPTLEHAGVTQVCGMGGKCTQEGDSWSCSCGNGYQKDSKSGICWPSACFGPGQNRVCGGGGECDLNAYTWSNACNCRFGYTRSAGGSTCLISNATIALSIAVPLLVLLGVGAFCIYWFVFRPREHRKLLSAAARGKGQAVRLNDADEIRAVFGEGNRPTI